MSGPFSKIKESYLYGPMPNLPKAMSCAHVSRHTPECSGPKPKRRRLPQHFRAKILSKHRRKMPPKPAGLFCLFFKTPLPRCAKIFSVTYGQSDFES